ncbi:heterogeneous nuclear ribonucleoprotein Q [Ricinus communis]|uniref:heterogeneous nuclear ribonucleoprotein Q n=1 Tax=Ricinus communis TaxID=3988 RepID=UPI00201AD3E8|nr:heterogeneous nuclear ribonucleoprotein Q [Ricinus communis]
MAEGTEVEERVDLDEEDNYMEEMEDDVEDQLDEDGDDDDDNGDANVEENAEEDDDDSKTEGSQEDQSPEIARKCTNSEPLEDDEKPTASVNEEEKEKHAQLLSLPPHGSEVFIGGLPKDALEDDLRDLCEPIGDIFEIRLMKDKDTGESKGFAFVAFRSKEVAQKAIEEIHSKEFKGKTLRCSLSETKNRLFVGNVPKNWTEDEFRKVVEEVGPGVDIIELIRDPQNPSRNRGFAFVLYYNNACADYSRQKMLNANFKLEGNTPTVSWADPKGTPDQSAAAAQVKALYVKNIPENTSTEQLKELFQRHGEVTKVVMPPGKAGKRDFGFIHYAERSSALKAVRDNEKYQIDGQVLEVVLAKPQTDKKPDGVYPYPAALHPSHVTHPAYGGFAGNPYSSLGGGFGVASSFQQPVIYGRGPMPAGMHMVPMVLPDGRIGYVLQQPGVQMPQPRPRRVERSNGSSGPGRAGSSGDDGNRSRRYRPY